VGHDQNRLARDRHRRRAGAGFDREPEAVHALPRRALRHRRAAGNAKATIIAAKSAVRAADEPILLVTQNDGPDMAAQTPLRSPRSTLIATGRSRCS